MWLDALLAYAHFIAIMLICSFLGAEVLLLRTDLRPKTIEVLAKADLGYFLSAGLVLLAGALRLGLSPKGFMFYAGNPVLWGKLGLFFRDRPPFTDPDPPLCSLAAQGAHGPGLPGPPRRGSVDAAPGIH